VLQQVASNVTDYLSKWQTTAAANCDSMYNRQRSRCGDKGLAYMHYVHNCGAPGHLCTAFSPGRADAVYRTPGGVNRG
jgi:hypothetical protein